MTEEGPITLVTIAQYDHPTMAHLVKSRLELEGIPCVIADEHIVSMEWCYSPAVGRIKVQVREADAGRAAAVLREDWTDVAVAEAPESEANPEPLRCPQCRSADVQGDHLSPPGAFDLRRLLERAVPFLRRSYACPACRHTWKA